MVRSALGGLVFAMICGCAIPPPPGSLRDGAVCGDCVDVPPRDGAAPDATPDARGDDVHLTDVADARDAPDAALDAPRDVGMDVPLDAPRDAPSDLPVDADCASMGLSTCPGVGCVDTRSDARHCGACGGACGAEEVCVASACARISAPRPMSPLSTATVTSQRPTLRWTLDRDVVGARVQLCADRDCATVQQVLNATGESAAPPSPLTPGVHFWRLAGRTAAGVVGAALSPTWSFTVGARSAAVDASAGTTLDVNGDGYADVAVGASGVDAVSVYLGGRSGVAATAHRVLSGVSGERFGQAVASAGDVNGDGFADLVVGAPRANPGGRTRAGAAYVFLGSATGITATPQATLEGEAAGDGFGTSVACAGDVNGDGRADVLVGARDADPAGRVGAGAAYVFLSSPGGIAPSRRRTFEGALAGDAFGVSVAGAVDLNADGYADLLIAAASANPGGRADAGTVSVFLGGASGFGTSPDRVIEGAVAGELLGAVGGAGDVNGDGYSDAIVGAIGASPGGLTGAGVARVYLGSASGLQTTPQATLNGPHMNAFFGSLVSGVGDVNGDGYADVAVSALYADGARPDCGGVYVYLGGAMGIAPSAQRALYGDAPGDLFGADLGGPGDLDRDGFADLVVGASEADPGGRLGAGAVSVYPGSGTGVPMTAQRIWSGTTAGGAFGAGVARRATRAPAGWCAALTLAMAARPG